MFSICLILSLLILNFLLNFSNVAGSSVNRLEYKISFSLSFKIFKGWNCSTKGIKKFDDLPDNAKNYIKELEKFVETKIASISTSPERNDTILIVDPFSV